MIKTKRAKPPLTGCVRGLIDGYIASDPAFRQALVQQAIKAMLAGDVDTGKTILRDYSRRSTASSGWAAPSARRPRT